MRRLSWLLATLLIACPVFAQDDGGGGDIFGGGGDIFGGGGGGGGNAGGGRGQAAAPDRLVTLRDMMAKANAPLSKDQEKALNTLLDKEIKSMSDAFVAKFGVEPGAAAGARGGQAGQAQGRGGQGRGGQGAQGGQVPPNGAQGQGRQGQGQAPGQGQAGGQAQGRGGQAGQLGQGGQAGGGFRGAAGAGAPAALAGLLPETPQAAEIRRMNEELLAKVTASLQPPQQAVIKKYQNDQIRARGGLDALKLTMDDAGASLTAEQVPQIQALYDEQNQTRIQLIRESQGQPDPTKVSALELTTLTKVIRLLNPEQRKALQDSMTKAKQ